MSQLISFVISPHGFGHLTRQIALGKELIRQRDNIRLNFICSQNHILKFGNLIKFNGNVMVSELPEFTPNLTMINVYQVDIKTSIDNFENALNVDSDLFNTKWRELLEESSLIINDIESLHNRVAKELKIPIINISNFTWSDIISGLRAKEIANKYSELENLVDISYQLPFASECSGFGDNYTKIGILANDIDWNWVIKTRKDSHNTLFVFFTRLGSYFERGMADLFLLLENENIGVIIPDEYTTYLPPSIKSISYSTNTPNIQDLIALSKIAVGKTGYSTISEAVTAGTLYIHWTRKEFIEDRYLSEALVQDGNGIRIELIKENNPAKLIYDLIINNIDHELKPRSNSNSEIAKSILLFLDENC